MLRVYRETNAELQEVQSIEQAGVWIHLVAPTDEELGTVSAATGLSLEFLRAALDEDERPRQETEGDQTLVLIHIPVARSPLMYGTIPLGIAVSPDFLVTVCLEDTPVVEGLATSGRVHPRKKTRLLLQLLYRTAKLYLEYLQRLDRTAAERESALRRSMRNEEMFDLMEIQKSLVFLTTALRANQIVMEKLLRSRLRPACEPENGGLPLRLYPEDEDLLEDAITENQQALSAAEVHSNILSGTMDAFASIISNNLNIVMKFLTAITIILAIPTVIGTFYGMNIRLPLQQHPLAFVIIMGGSVLVGVTVALLLWRRRML
ncbi:MAG TPA: magnesium transporter CorA family protein [Firmicutes bacterium]|nr:magnesium transporter CorA family protein [Bacillota bacterium]